MFAGLIIAAQGAALGGKAAATGPVELWPQPAFAGSAGLTLVRSAIAGGVWHGDGSGGGIDARCTVTSPPTFLPGEVYSYSITTTNPNEDDVELVIGGQNVATPIDGGTATGTVTIGASPTQVLQIVNIDNDDATVTVSACSVQKVS